MDMQRRHFLRLSLPLAVSSSIKAAPADPADDTPTLSFGVLADPQYADQATRGTRHYRASLGKLETAVQELNTHPLHFVVTLGDTIDKNLRSFDDIMPIYQKLKAPRRFVLGNHDFEVADEDKDKVLPALGMERPYFREEVGSWTFLYLDGTDLATWRHPRNDPRTTAAFEMLRALQAKKVRSAASWNAAIGPRQLDWLTKELQRSKERGQQVILFNHFPIFPANDPHNLWNAPELLTLLGQYDHIAAYLNGHNHAGNYALHQGTHYLNLKGMVETQAQTAYSIVRCFPDRLEVDGFGTEPNRTLP
jgi:3',5'-cyclic AMP phosphodiesterase CpdA